MCFVLTNDAYGACALSKVFVLVMHMGHMSFKDNFSVFVHTHH